MMHIVQEYYYMVQVRKRTILLRPLLRNQDFPFDPTRTDNWVLSFVSVPSTLNVTYAAHTFQGDTSGFGLHADFANGWNVTLLQQAINDPTCNSAEAGIEKCEAFSRWNVSTIPPCMPSGMYPNEPVGLDNRPLTALPGVSYPLLRRC